MSFLTPLFLLGALAIAGPVIFHLIRRTTRERTVFSSLQFLQPTPPRLTRRSRIEHWLLLLLRCLALGLLAFGFARPFLPRATTLPPADSQSKRVVLLVDTSASLQRPGAWEAARDRAVDWARRLSTANELGLYTFDRSVQPLLSFADWRSAAPSERAALVRSRLEAVQPGWGATRLGPALISATETLNEITGGPEPEVRQVVLISDLQEGSHLESLQAYDWPKGVTLVIEPIGVRQPGNAGLQLVTDEVNVAPASNAVVRVRINNTADATTEQFEVGWLRPEGAGFLGLPAKTYVPAGQSRTVVLPVPDETGVDRIGLTGDHAPFDNTVYLAPPKFTRARVLYLGQDADGEARKPLFFLKRAFPEGGRPEIDWVTRTPGDLTEADAATGPGLTMVTSPLPSAAASILRRTVTEGGTLVYVLSDPASAVSLAELLGTSALPAEEAGGSFALLGEIDFRHPLFAPFADPRFGDFTKIRLWKHRRLDVSGIPHARVLARLDSGDPGIVEIPLGRGRIVVLTSGWHPEDSQWALSTKFVPFLHALLEYSGALPPLVLAQYQVGDPLPLPATSGTESRKIRLPDGTEQSLDSGATQFANTRVPGLYWILGAGDPLALAVNLDPAESRTLPTAGDELERLGAPLSGPEATPTETQARREALQATEAESRQKLWRWFLGATILVLLMETAVAGWSARRAHATLEATA